MALMDAIENIFLNLLVKWFGTFFIYGHYFNPSF